MRMPHLTIAVAALLLVMGLAAYLVSGMASWTALIPTFFGLGLGLAGALALKERLRMHAMHAAVLIALLGGLGAARGFAALPALLDGTAERPLAVVMQIAMCVVLLVYVVLCVRSFIAARRARHSSSESSE